MTRETGKQTNNHHEKIGIFKHFKEKKFGAPGARGSKHLVDEKTQKWLDQKFGGRNLVQLLVSNVSLSICSCNLRTFFADFSIKHTAIITNETESLKATVHVILPMKDARRLILEYHGKEFDGNVLNIAFVDVVNVVHKDSDFDSDDEMEQDGAAPTSDSDLGIKMEHCQI